MSVAFTKAYKIDKKIQSNPVQDITIPNKQAKPRKALTLDELSQFLKSIENSRWIWSVKFALITGLRRGELLALRWTDVQWDDNRIVVDKSNSSTGLGNTKSNKVHYVPLSQTAKTYLINQMDMLKKEDNPVVVNDDNSRKYTLKGKDLLVFPAFNGKMIKPNTYYQTIVRYAKKSGIKVHPHCFRHTFVFNMRKVLSLKELQEALGHDESTTTLDIYGDMINDTIDKTAGDIDRIYSKIELDIEKARCEIEKEQCKVIDIFSKKQSKLV
jgi:integrase